MSLPPSTPTHPAPAIILVRPQMPENIGMVARAMANFGLHDLRLVTPRETFPHKDATAAAAGAAAWLDDARVFASVEEAIADLTYIFATTARPRNQLKPVANPADAVSRLLDYSKNGHKSGVLFGAERTGLTNDELAAADAVLTFPINPDFTSLNLAQAVLLFGYNWLTCLQGDDAPFRETAFSAVAPKSRFNAFMHHLEEKLEHKGYFYPLEKKQLMQRNLRNIMQRLEPTEQDLRTLYGVITSLGRESKPPAPSNDR